MINRDEAIRIIAFASGMHLDRDSTREELSIAWTTALRLTSDYLKRDNFLLHAEVVVSGYMLDLLPKFDDVPKSLQRRKSSTKQSHKRDLYGKRGEMTVIYPKADVWRPLPKPERPLWSEKPTLLVYHTNGGPHSAFPKDLWNYQSYSTTKIFSHMDIGLDGEIWQGVDLANRATCNAAANPWSTAVELQDHGYLSVPTDEDPLSVEQCVAIVDFTVWWCKWTGISPIKPDKWNGDGVGVHVDFPEWSESGHTCPGKIRTKQLRELLILAEEILEMEENMADVFALDSDPNRLFVQTSDKKVRHVTGDEGVIAEHLRPGWAVNKKILSVNDLEPTTVRWLESMD